MGSIKRSVLLVFAGVVLSRADAQVLLEAKYSEPFSAELKTEYRRGLKTIKGETKDRSESVLLLHFRPQKPADGSRRFEMEIASFKEVQTDAAGKTTTGTAPEFQGAVLQITLDSGLNVTRVEGIDAIIKKMDPKGQAKPATRAYQLDNLDNVVRWWTGQVLVPFPEKPIQPGDKWDSKSIRPLSAYGNLRLTKEITYRGTESQDGKDLHKLTFTSAHAFAPLRYPDVFPFKVSRVTISKAEYTGTIWFDAVAGRPVRSEAKLLHELPMTLSYDSFTREVRLHDEGVITVRYQK